MSMTSGYDAVLLVGFGGPEAPDEVRPFLEQVTRGRGVPPERLDAVAEHYLARGGISPINGQVRALATALDRELGARGQQLPVTWGNRNSAPWLADTMADLAAAGHRRILAVLTSAYPSYSGCRQYRENLFDAVTAAGVTDHLQIDLAPHYATTAGFITANVDAVAAARDRLQVTAFDAETRLVFVTHSVPTAMAEVAGVAGDAYVGDHRRAAQLVADQVGAATWDLVYCSRSGSPRTPWLEPDVNDHLTALAGSGVRRVVLSPIGFISDHMEVINDLDEEAAQSAAAAGITFERAATAGTHPAFVGALADLVDSAANGGILRCPASCCPNPREPGRGALAEAAAS